jgi:hypothetical protein
LGADPVPFILIPVLGESIGSAGAGGVTLPLPSLTQVLGSFGCGTSGVH